MAMLWLVALFAFLIGVIIYLANTGNLGFAYWVYDFPHGDKVAHVILLGLVTLPASLGMLHLLSGDAARIVLRAAGAIGALITLEEVSQAFLPRRSLDPYDLAASYMGIAGAALLAYTLRGIMRQEVSVRDPEAAVE